MAQIGKEFLQASIPMLFRIAAPIPAFPLPVRADAYSSKQDIHLNRIIIYPTRQTQGFKFQRLSPGNSLLQGIVHLIRLAQRFTPDDNSFVMRRI
jgi:hypothetical protein